MKNILISIALVLLTCHSCIFANNGKEKGNGNVTTEQRTVSPFSSIKIGGVMNVYLTQGDTESVTVEIDENLQQYVTVRNDGNMLILDSKDKFRKATKNNVYITLKNIDGLNIGGVGNIQTQTAIKSDRLKLGVGGVANLRLEVDCSALEADCNSVGKIELRGITSELTVKNSGVGSITTKELKAEKVSVINSGVGKVHVYASQELTINNSGVGNVTYEGDAVIQSVNNSGVGSIKKVK